MQGIKVDDRRFRQFRLARGLTQRELSQLAGVSERTVRNAEAGRRVRLDFIRFLASALGVEVLDIVHESEELRVGLSEQRRVDHIFTAIDAYANGAGLSEIINLVANDILINWPGPVNIPFAGEYRGIDGARAFFDRTSEAISYEAPPEISDIRTSGNLVVISGFDCLRANPTGKLFTSKWMHVYEFDKGRIGRLDIWSDTAAVQEAFQPGSST